MLPTVYFLLSTFQSQPSELLDAAVAMPAEVIAKQLSTKGAFVANGFEFADERLSDTLIRRKTSMTPLDVLIARGADSIPYLISQLPSQEPSALKIGDDPNTVSAAYEFYDPKVRLPDTDYWSVVTNDFLLKAPPYKHTITRGDIAFFALGQITNRWYGILGGASGLTLLCSSSEHSVLQKAAKDDWTKCGSDDLKTSLRYDVLHADSYARLTYGFVRFRTYFPTEAAELAIDCLRTTYGKTPKNEPDAGQNSFIKEFQTVPSPALDEECQRILMRTDKANGFLNEYELTKYEIILYLRSRPNYLPICLNFAQDQVKTKKDKYGYFKRFLENYGKRKVIS
jgi:hypothetical protein